MKNFSTAALDAFRQFNSNWEWESRYVIVNLDASNIWQLVYESTNSESFTDLWAHLKDDSCCFIVYRLPQNPEGLDPSAKVSITWAPEGAALKARIKITMGAKALVTDLPVDVVHRFKIETRAEMSLASLQSQL